MWRRASFHHLSEQAARLKASGCTSSQIGERLGIGKSPVRNLVRAGIAERVAMQMTGHKTRSVFERYNIVSQGDLFDAARKLDATATAAQESVQRASSPAL